MIWLINMPKVSILTPTVRIDGLDVVQESLEQQTFKDFEWLIGSKEDPKRSNSHWIRDDFTGGFWSLNRIYNSLFKHSKGDIIVTLQDWISIPPDGIEKFVTAVEETGGVVSGVGDQYESIDEMGIPQVRVWADPRKTDKHGSFYEIFPNDAEWNWCAFPKKLIFEIGGMDERLDYLGFGGDQFQVGERWDDVGVKFYIDQTNESFTVRHDRSAHGGQKNWDGNHVLFNGAYNKRKQELIQQGKWPRLDYLELV